MLIEFRVSNYRSIGEEQILSLVPDKKKGDPNDNIIEKGKHKALNSIAIYGNNASGKSNLLLSMSLLDKLVHLSARSSSTTKLPYDPFLLRKGFNQKPTKFEITFILNDAKYRYGIMFFENEIESEWLFKKSKGREVDLFLRKGELIDTSSAFKGNPKIIDLAIEATKPNALFLSTCDMFNIDEAKEIFQWFKHFVMIDGLNTEDEVLNTVNLWENENYKSKIGEYFERLNLGVLNIDVAFKEFDSSELPKNLNENTRDEIINQLKGKKRPIINTIHKLYDEEGNITNNSINWDIKERESAGTNKIFHLSGPILWALSNGGVLIVDEIEAKLHPIMTLDTINLFLKKETNPNNAQLIFATHDTNLLSYSKLRRDQIYFSEKNSWESTEIYSLSDFIYIDKANKSKRERPDSDKGKRYFEGRYGAIPILSDFFL
ncbi:MULTISPECIES: ATP-binding protein [unclassified Arcicella]|uniref:AAA family ATPase n=1 Tax=unclassified Arcicella TaxID=2644986 RepID=UPI00285BC4E4|nr:MULTISPECIES: ATP-binding protein [unclassified Arcicella]MDR6563807.1 AAA15 family ATPase/GTPase [Arcicella sp. BE51]MDR6813509.1 AAA15 family ATPase/GTPase [Arcicella sp. BE140]MDR6824822.1 AAA15 family ATPase/GTPase [Arcicella sp. BE139]|eukprot:GDKJ01031142.1.p1 GENE.GDKJ01031142.1~~GDKJ01031142.1.p1  ORF type:complete len:433 (-),score=37.64 GDKJ01031142.1:641-1939(-)